jgi:hypothetical protein
MRPFEANGIARRWDDFIPIDLCGQWVNRKLVRYDEVRLRNLPLRRQRVRIRPRHEAFFPRERFLSWHSERCHKKLCYWIVLFFWDSPFNSVVLVKALTGRFQTILSVFIKSSATDFLTGVQGKWPDRPAIEKVMGREGRFICTKRENQ